MKDVLIKKNARRPHSLRWQRLFLQRDGEYFYRPIFGKRDRDQVPGDRHRKNGVPDNALHGFVTVFCAASMNLQSHRIAAREGRGMPVPDRPLDVLDRAVLVRQDEV